jgi:hypothetical protein
MDEKKPNPGAFKKGDPRINRKGRPKSFDALRELARKISHEPAPTRDGKVISVIEAMMRIMATSNPEKFIEIAYGKVPQSLDVTSGGEKLGNDDADNRAEILRKLDSIAAATGASGVPGKPE